MKTVGGFALFLTLFSAGALSQEPEDTPKAQTSADTRVILPNTLPGEAYNVENIELKRDVGTLTLRSGQIAFLAPVMQHTVMAVFAGDGQFHLKPAIPIEEAYLTRLIGTNTVDEKFSSALLVFTDSTFEEITNQAKSGAV